jgi:hypothetical protein
LTSGGCVAVGSVGFSTKAEGWLIRLGAAGTIDQQWSYACQKLDCLLDVTETADGGFLALGQANLDPSGHGGDAWLMKLDKSLAPQWNKTYDLGGQQNDFRRAVALPGGGYLLAGRYYDADGASSLVVRINATGGVVWAIKIEATILNDMSRTPDGGCLLLTQAWDDWNWLPALVKLNASGQVQWAKSSDKSYNFRSGFVTSAGDAIIGGSSGSYNLVLKVSTAGALKWQSAFGPTFSYTSKIFTAPGGGAYFVGSYGLNTQVFVAKTTGTGGLSFVRGYTPFTGFFQEAAEHALRAADGSLVLFCNAPATANAAIVRFDANGRTNPKCKLFPIQYKRTNPKLVLQDISLTLKKVKLTVKSPKVTRTSTTGQLSDTCK